MGSTEADVESMFKGVVAVFVETGAQSRRLQVWKQKLQQRGGEIRQRIKPTVTHIFAINVKFLEDRVGRPNLRKLRKVLLLKYEWLEDCLKTGHALSTDPYLLVHESAAQSVDGSVRSSTIVDNDVGSSDPSSLELLQRAEARKRRAESESDESSETHRKVDEDWMRVIHKGANAGVLGSKRTNTAPGDDTVIAESDSQEPNQAEMIYSPPNLNKNITDIFDELRTIYGDALGDVRRSFSYHKANSVLEKLPQKITSVDDVKKLPTIGKSLQENIGEILTTGTLAKLEHLKNDEEVKAITELSKVWGIGPTTARKLYAKGHRTLNDLLSEESLTTAQKIGLKFHNDIKEKIPRHEAQEMETLVRKVAKSIERNVSVVCGGSYRRGKAFVGDLDIIVTHPDGESHVGFLRKLLPKLREIDFLTEDLRLAADHDTLGAEQAVDTYFGLCKYPGREQRHRIDFKVYPYRKYPFGLIAWTGNDVLNRRHVTSIAKKVRKSIISIIFVKHLAQRGPCYLLEFLRTKLTLSLIRLRILAIEKGFKLDDQGCFPVLKDADGESIANRSFSVPCKTEQEVFDFLGFPWLEPHERNL